MLLEKGIATKSSILAWRIPRTEEPDGYSPMGCKDSDTTEHLSMHIDAVIGAQGYFVTSLNERCHSTKRGRRE